MASKVSQINDPEHDVFQGLWKLKDSVKVRISTANGAELVEQMQETKVAIYRIIALHVLI